MSGAVCTTTMRPDAPAGGFDAHAPGIDRRIRPVLRPFDPEHFALRRAEITDYIEYRRHSL